MKQIYYIIFILIVVNVMLSAWWVFHGDIRYDVDISRDFLLIKEIIISRPITLIGSHTSVSGVFHGPAWYYLNVPAFFVSGGNPVLMGWFWWGLSILNLIILFYVSQKIFNRLTAFLTILLYSANTIINPIYGLKMFFPPYGAVILFPAFFYLFLKYISNKKTKYLIGALLALGFIIQFEMAFGVPILLLTTFFLIYFLYTKKLYKHWLIFPVIFLPLSTFILFDLRHSFLQTTSLIKYVQSEMGRHSFDLLTILVNKVNGIFSDTFFLLTQDNRILSWLYSILFIILSLKVKKSARKIYFLFLYFYLGYWILHLSLKPLWSSYYWPLLPLTIMLYSAFINFFSRKVFLIIFIPLLIWNMHIGISYIKDFKIDLDKRGPHSWAFNKLVAETIFNDAKGDFGYFTLTPDRWVYQSWYAIDFVQKNYPQKKAHPFEKQKITYLIIVDFPKEYPEPISQGWKITDLKIKSEPTQVKNIGLVQIQKYYLTEEEINLPVNPFLLNSIFFR